MDRSQRLLQSILQEGVVHQNQVQQSDQPPHLASYPNHPALGNNSIQDNVFPSVSNPLSSVPQPCYFLPSNYQNSTDLASSVWNSPYPCSSAPSRLLDTDLPTIPTANSHPATRPAIENPQAHSRAPPNACIPGNASRPSKKIKCLKRDCNQLMRSDNLLVHLRTVHREFIPPGTRLKDWIHNHTASEV